MAEWDQIITPRRSLFDLRLAEIWQYRDLLVMFAKRNVVTVYSQTVLGPLWYIIQPLVSTVIFTMIFGRIAQISTDGIPDFLFYLTGTIAWGYFAACFKEAAGTFVANAGIFGKVYFPRLVVPLASVISSLVQFFIQLVILALFVLYYKLTGVNIAPGAALLILPLLIFEMAVVGLATGIIVSALTTKYRDIGFLMNFGIQLWMYASPVIYPVSTIPQKFRLIYNLNPMASILENFRRAVTGVGDILWTDIAIGAGVTAVMFIVGVVLFNLVEKTSIDTV